MSGRRSGPGVADQRPIELGEIKEQLRAKGGGEDVILIWRDAVVPEVQAVCQLNRGLRNEPMHALARDGVIRYAVPAESLASVPERWRPFTVSLDDLDDREPCRCTWGPSSVFIHQAEERHTGDPERASKTPGLWPTPVAGYRGVGSIHHAFLQVGDDFYNKRQLEREAATKDLAELPTRELRTISRARFTISLKAHYAQPAGEGLSWDLEFDHRGTKHILHGGTGTHDPQQIAADIRAHEAKILSRMKQVIQEHPQERQLRGRGLEH